MDPSEQMEGYNLTDTIWIDGYNLTDKSVSKLYFNLYLYQICISMFLCFKLDFLYSGYFCNLTKFRISVWIYSVYEMKSWISIWIHTEIQDFYVDP